MSSLFFLCVWWWSCDLSHRSRWCSRWCWWDIEPERG